MVESKKSPQTMKSCVNYLLNPQIMVWGYMSGLQPNFSLTP